MDNPTPRLQEGTRKYAGHTGVPNGKARAGQQAGATAPDAEPDMSHTVCPTVNDVLSRVGDKWSMQVVMRLGFGSLRFNQLRREIEGISQRMLTRTLRGLERDGLVSRKVTPSVPPRVDYALTALGESLRGPVSLLGEWAVANSGAVSSAREDYDLREQG